MKRLLYIVIALLSPLLMAQSTVVCTTASPGTVIGSCASGVTSPITTDPLSFSGVVTFDNAANTPLVFADGLQDSTLMNRRVTFADAVGRLSGDADLTFATDTLSATKVSVKGGSGSGALSVGGVICKGAPAAATAGTTEEVLATCTIPANTLSADGASIRLTFFGHTAANAHNKAVFARIGGIGGTLLYQSASAALNNQNFWTAVPILITRNAATTCTSYGQTQYNPNASSAGATSWNFYSLRAGAAIWANALDLVITSTTPTAAGDLTLDSYSVEVVQ